MATKYAGQNALNKLMQLVKTALNNKADKTNATTSAAGLMSAADKVKLDGVEAGATKTTVDAALDAGSANPVQNKAIKAELDKKLNKTGGTVGGNLVVDGSLRTGTFSATNLGIYTSDLSHGVTLTCDDGSSASLAGEAAGTYARLSVGAPTDGNDATTKTYVDNKVSGLQTAAQVKSAINSALTGVYTPKGSIAFASLPTAAAGNKGWVYNVSDAFTTTAAFVEGAGHSYGAGTNVVCVDAGSGSYKWDVLAGIIDLTELTADEVQTLWNSI